jgi:CheY-like chemotaxis protein
MSLHSTEVREEDWRDGSFSILLVEDDLLTLEMMELLLSDYGYDVVKASTYAEALEAAENYHVDLVISDIGLPDGSAYKLMKILHDRYSISGISVSGYSPEEGMRDAGFVDHITKPVEFNELVEKIEKLRQITVREREARVLPFA